MEIEVVRPKQFADIFRDYHLLVDGKEAAVIKRGATQTITLPEGSGVFQPSCPKNLF